MKILLSTLSALLLLGCSGDGQKTVQKEMAAEQAAAATPSPEDGEALIATETAAAEKDQMKLNPAVAATEPPVAKTSSPVDGAALFKHKCATCHGQMAEKHALNTSQIIAGWEKEKVLEALHGYKSGSYGGTMKGMMQGQIKALSDAEIDALAGYISTL